MKKIMLILLSVLITMSFIPMAAFADDPQDTLTPEQVSSASTVEDGGTLSMPDKGVTSYYKFTANDNYSNYRVCVKLINSDNIDFSAYLYKTDESGETVKVSGGTSYGSNLDLYVNLGKIVKGNTYYVALTNDTGISAKKVTLSGSHAIPAKFKTPKGTMLTYTGSTNAYTTLTDGTSYQMFECITAKGYGFKGIYSGKTKLDTGGYTKYGVYYLVYSSKLSGKTLSVKCVKIGSKASKVQAAKITGLKAVNKGEGTIRLNWKKSKVKYDKYIIYTHTDDSYSFKTTTSTSYGFFDENHDETLYIYVRGVKKIKGINVYTKWSHTELKL